MRGLLITIEGMDTTGKTTQAKRLKKKLEAKGKKVILMHFPNEKGLIGEYIYKILNDEKRFSNIDKRSFQMLYAAEQLNAQSKIQKYLEQDYVVILDRYDMSTVVYYALTQGVSLEDSIWSVYNKYQESFIRPDVTYILTMPVSEIAKRKKVLDNMEKLNNIKVANEIYHNLPNKIHDRRYFITIDANTTEEEVHKKMYKYISQF